MPRSNAVTRLVNSNNPGQLDKQVDLYGPHVARSATGSPASAFVLMEAGLWAAIVEMPERSGEADDPTQVRSFKSYRIKLRYRADVSDACLLKRGDDWLEVKSTNTMGMRNEWLIIMCRSWSRPSAPVIARATTAGDTRVTAAGDTRVIE